MKKNKKEEVVKTSTVIIGVVLLSFLVFSLLVIGVDVGLKKGEEEGIEKGMNQAELNCLEIICDNNDCSTIQIITEVQNYCKGLVYGTDFYLGLK